MYFPVGWFTSDATHESHADGKHGTNKINGQPVLFLELVGISALRNVCSIIVGTVIVVGRVIVATLMRKSFDVVVVVDFPHCAIAGDNFFVFHNENPFYSKLSKSKE